MMSRGTRRERDFRVMVMGALAGMAILKVVMLAALFTQTSPHPPLALAPLFGASLALAALCGALIWIGSRWFLVPAVLVVLESLLSYGPQKLYPGESSFFAQTPAVYPVILVGSALIVILCVNGWRLFAAFRTPPGDDRETGRRGEWASAAGQESPPYTR